jgi:hypothetical protein
VAGGRGGGGGKVADFLDSTTRFDRP